MDDVIYRKDAIKILNAQCYRGTDYEDVCGKDCECAEYMALRDLPSARKKGEWQEKAVVESEDSHIDAWQSAKCSVCERYHTTPYLYFFTDYNFCPHCGADMRGEDDG